MPIKLNTASGGGVILQGANTASDKTITIPADDGTMIYANSGGNVGIGTSSPGEKLSVAGNINLTGNGFLYSYNGGSSGQVRAGFQCDGTNQQIVFATATNERARIDSSGNLVMTGGGQIRGSTTNVPPLLADSAGNTAACRAWAQFSGLASPTIQGSFNVSSITRTATGQFRLNFTVAMSDTNYSACVGNGGYGYTVITVAIATTSVTFGTYYPAGGYADGNTLIGMAVFR